MKPLSPFSLFLSFLGLMFFWVVMSGMLQPAQIGQGVLCSAIVIAINRKLKGHKFFEDEIEDLTRLQLIRVPLYIFWLLKEMILAGLHVASVLLRPSLPIDTYIIKFRVDLPSAHAKMVLGNSITLTPGTVTIDIDKDLFTVHALTADSFAGIADDSMPRKVLKLFEKEGRQVVHDLQIINNAEEISRK